MERVYADGLRSMLAGDGIKVTFAVLCDSEFDSSLVSSIKSGYPMVMHPMTLSNLVVDTLEPFQLYYN